MPIGKPWPLSVTSSAADSPLQRHSTRTRVARGVALDVGERLLGDAPHLPFLQDRQPAVRGRSRQLDRQPLRSRTRRDVGLEGGRHVLAVGDVGAQVVEGVADLADHRRGRRRGAARASRSTSSPRAWLAHDAVELEGQVGEGLADAIVQVTGDAGAFLVGADGAQPGEPAGVVDGQGDRLDEPLEQLGVAVVEVALARCPRWRCRPMIDPRAGSTAYRPQLALSVSPGRRRRGSSGTLTTVPSSMARRTGSGQLGRR